VHVRKANVHDEAELSKALAGSDVVINLVGILNEAGKQPANSFDGAHKELTQRVVKVCESVGVPRYLHMSSLNADAKNGSSEYLKSKGAGEDAVKASKSLSWTIFQPSIIFGEKDAFFNRFAALLTSLPVFPLACPDARMAPVHVNDVTQSMISALSDVDTIGQIVKLCGPADYTLQELVEFTAQTCGLKRKIIRLPDGLARLQARIMGFLPGKPFSYDNYLSLQTDSVCDANCDRQTTSIEAIVPRYLGKSTGLTGRHQTRREMARR